MSIKYKDRIKLLTQQLNKSIIYDAAVVIKRFFFTDSVLTFDVCSYNYFMIEGKSVL